MKLLICAVFFALALVSSGQTHLAITSNGHSAGYATLSQHIQKDGTKLVELRMEIGTGDHKIRINSQATYDSKGMPVRKFQETLTPGGAHNRQIIATFDKNGANVIFTENEKRSTKAVSLAATAPRSSLSEFWVIRDKPKPGQSEDTYEFDMDSLEWDLVRTEYKGHRSLKIEGRQVPIHEIVTKRGDKISTTYLDEQGLPILVDLGDVKMVKIWPK